MLLYNRDAQPWQGSLDSVSELFLCWEENELTGYFILVCIYLH